MFGIHKMLRFNVLLILKYYNFPKQVSILVDIAAKILSFYMDSSNSDTYLYVDTFIKISFYT